MNKKKYRRFLIATEDVRKLKREGLLRIKDEDKDEIIELEYVNTEDE